MTITQDWKGMHPIQLAKYLGEKTNRKPGMIIMPELEASFLLRCTLQDRYTDKKKVGLRRHVIAIAPKDTTKTTLVLDFFTKLTGGIPYLGSDRARRITPIYPKTYTTLSASTTWEAMRGGYHERCFYLPMCHDLDWMVATELFAWFGHTKHMMESKMDQLNVALQEARIEFNLVKAKGAPQKEIQRFAEDCQTAGVDFDASTLTIAYDSKFTFVGCTRPFTDEQYKTLNDSGFLGRCVLAEWDPNDDELFQYSINPFGQEEPELEAALLEMNQYARRCTFGKVQYPTDRKRLLAIIGNIAFAIKRIAERTGLKYDDLRQGRVWQQVVQLVTAHAISRELKHQRDAGIVDPHMDIIPYGEEDYEYAFQAWMQNRLSHINRRAMRISNSKDSIEEGLVKFITSTVDGWVGSQVTAGKVIDLANVEVLLNSGAIVKDIMAGLNLKQSTAYNRLNKLVDCGYLVEHSHHGYETVYMVTDKGLIAAGRPEFVVDVADQWGNASVADALRSMMSEAEIEEMQKELLGDIEAHDEELRVISMSEGTP